jgi:hypothetical protein
LVGTLNDYLWFSLKRCSWSSNSQNDGLKRLQSSILSLGATYFNEDGTQAVNYYKVLIMSQLFQEAIIYLHIQQEYLVQNTLVAFALDQIGVFRMLKPVRSEETKDSQEVNISKILESYSMSLPESKLPEAIVYLSLAAPNKRIELICDRFMKADTFDLLGGVGDTKIKLKTISGLTLAELLGQQEEHEIIKKVCDLVRTSTNDPHVVIILSHKV